MNLLATIEICGFEGTLTLHLDDVESEDSAWSVLEEQIEQIKLNDCSIELTEY